MLVPQPNPNSFKCHHEKKLKKKTISDKNPKNTFPAFQIDNIKRICGRVTGYGKKKLA